MRAKPRVRQTLKSTDRGAPLGTGKSNEPNFSRQSELIADSFAASGVVRLMNKIIAQDNSAIEASLPVITEGIRLAERMLQGIAYVERTETPLFPPETTETVKYMQAHGVTDIGQRTEMVIPFLRNAKKCLEEGEATDLLNLDRELVEETRKYFRQIDASIGELLGRSNPPNEESMGSLRTLRAADAK